MCLGRPHNHVPGLQNSVPLAPRPRASCTAWPPPVSVPRSSLSAGPLCMRAQASTKGIPLSDLSWEHIHQVMQIFTTLCMAGNDFEVAILIWGCKEIEASRQIRKCGIHE